MGGKLSWKPGNMVLPAPAALVSCQRQGEAPNLLTIAWCGNINSAPPMLSISVQPIRHSHPILVDSGEFVLNLPGKSIARAVDYCGVVSGRAEDKWRTAGLTPCAMEGVTCPGVAECPVNIACRITRRIPLGSHDLFLAEVVSVAVDAALVDGEGRFQLERADLLCYAHGHYFTLGEQEGHFGWSIRKRKPRPSRGPKGRQPGKTRHGPRAK